MKKVLILSVADLRHMTCASFYSEYFNSHQIEFDIICMKRYEEKVSYNYKCNIYEYDCNWDNKTSRFNKILPFLRFKHYALSIIKQNSYDFIVVWGENAGVLFGNVLKKSYKERYCLNVRDVDSKIINLLIEPVIRNSLFSTIPTLAHIENLRYDKLYVLLNNDKRIISKCPKKESLKKKGEVLQITYMGLIHPYLDTFKKFIEAFANDSRFILAFYGNGADTELKKIIEEKNITNVIIGGTFLPDQTSEYLKKTDIINSYYGTGTKNLKMAMGVKEGYGPPLRIPTIADADTLWEKISVKYNFGIAVSNLNVFPNELYDWYHSLEFSEFDKGCDGYCSLVENTNKKIVDRLEKL